MQKIVTKLVVSVAMAIVITAGGLAPAFADADTDTTKPVVGPLVFSVNPWMLGGPDQPPTVTITPTDDASGVIAAEYYIYDTDPGIGQAGPMVDAGNGTYFMSYSGETPPGIYPVHIRVQDGAGNWSDTANAFLVAYSPSNSTVKGRKTVVPTLASGDVLPGLINTNQTDKAKFEFNAKYNNLGFVDSSSDLTFSYKTGAHCNNPAHATNCHSIALDATTIDWLVIDGNQQSRGIFQGTASVEVDGVTTTNLFRVTAIDGTQLDPMVDDTFTLTIYAPGADANTSPIYQVSQPIERGNIRIRLL